jgi:hypothetical protein
MELESSVVHGGCREIAGCDEGIRLAKTFLIECGMAVWNLSVSDPTDQRFDFLCKYNALVRHRDCCLECSETANQLTK